MHLAAQVGRLFGEQDLVHTITSNALMTTLVAKACADHKTRLLYASTSEIYGDHGEEVCVDDWAPFSKVPHNLYGLSKRWGEEAIRLYKPYGYDCFLRFSMPYGPGVPPGRGRAALPNILWQAINGMDIPIHRGSERSWCYVGDTVRAVRLLIEDQLLAGPFNIGRDDIPLPMETLAEMACDMVGASTDLIKLIDPPAAQTVVKRLSMDKIQNATGWKPEVDLHDGMKRTLEWVKTFDAEGNKIA